MTESKDTELAPIREQIDRLDGQIVSLLNERARLAQEVGRIKYRTGAPVFRPEREAQVLRELTLANSGPLSGEAIGAIYREVMSACRALEKRMRVAYLGPAGTYSEQAALAHFGQSIETVACASIDEIFRVAETGGADFGVVPVENSTEGAISRSLDLLLQTPLTISGEIALRIDHYLWSRTGTMDKVTSVRAHPQALAQCLRWLNAHYPSVAREPANSNGEAAAIAGTDPAVAAIASVVAGPRYGLTEVAAHIQDDAQNTTRFAIIGSLAAGPSGQDRTSLILSVQNKSGAVYEMLAPFARHGVSMTRFESRPARTGNWTYYFYVDVEGHQDDEKLRDALSELKSNSGFFKILGSYPV